jgi:FtsZ-interacting cell division protein ZipA
VSPRRPDVLPILILVAIVGLILVGLWLFPRLQAALSFQDCVATGRANCAPPGR